MFCITIGLLHYNGQLRITVGTCWNTIWHCNGTALMHYLYALHGGIVSLHNNENICITMALLYYNRHFCITCWHYIVCITLLYLVVHGLCGTWLSWYLAVPSSTYQCLVVPSITWHCLLTYLLAYSTGPQVHMYTGPQVHTYYY